MNRPNRIMNLKGLALLVIISLAVACTGGGSDGPTAGLEGQTSGSAPPGAVRSADNPPPDIDTNLPPARRGADVPVLKSSATLRRAESGKPYVVRSRSVDVDLTGLPAAGYGPQQKSSPPTELALFDDVVVQVKLTAVEAPTATSEAWTGIVVGEPDSFVSILVYGDLLSGRVSCSRGEFQIRPTGGDSQVVEELNGDAMPTCKTPDVDSCGEGEAEAAPLADSDVGPVLDILMVYTPAARIAAGGQAQIEALCLESIQLLNAAFARSHIRARARVVYLSEISYTEDSSQNTDLNRFEFTDDGHMDVVHTWRDESGADLCMLVTGSDEHSGLANCDADQTEAFCLSRWDLVAANLTGPHEIGHLLGCDHDPDNSSTFCGESYATGHVVPGSYRTVMAYPCPDTFCPRVPQFSNPRVTYLGTPTGVVDVSDHARVINATAAPASRFRVRETQPKVILGLGTNGEGWGETKITDANAATLSHETWTQLPWMEYAENLSGSTRIATGDIDGDGFDESVWSLGPDGEGWFWVSNGSQNTWGRVQWDAPNNSADSSTFPGCADIDGDGRDEIIIGLGPNGAGWFEVFDYDPEQNFLSHKAWGQVPWSEFQNSSDPSVFPAGGDLDGDQAGATPGQELVLGLGGGGGGYFYICRYEEGGAFVPYPGSPDAGGWGRANWNRPPVHPSVGDLNDDGFDDVVFGFGPGGEGWIESFTSSGSSLAHDAWFQVPWMPFVESGNSSTYPCVVDLYGDQEAHILIGLGTAGEGYFLRLDPGNNNSVDWFRTAWEGYNNSGNAPTYPQSFRGSY